MSDRLKVLRAIASLHVTVASLVLLAILVVWGTIFQASYGLYAAMQHIFAAWVVLAGGIVPLPGMKLVMAVLFINLVLALFYRIQLAWRNSGLIVIHIGLLLLIFGAFVISLTARETYLTLLEGEESSMSSAYGDWELYFSQQETGAAPQQYAIAGDNFVPGRTIPIADLNVFIQVREYYANCQTARAQNDSAGPPPLNVAGAGRLIALPPAAEPVENMAGGVFSLRLDLQQTDILLHGRDRSPTVCTLAGKRFKLLLRHQTNPLPCSIRLLSFKMLRYPGSDIVKSYESQVALRSGALTRAAMISMNKPLRFKDFTFYQSSYSAAENGRYFSTFSVVENSGRLIPYISSIMTFIGLAWHFMLLAWRRLQPLSARRDS